MQVDPIKPTLKASGTKRLTLKSDEPLSNVAFKFNLRRYTKALAYGMVYGSGHGKFASEMKVGQCRLTL